MPGHPSSMRRLRTASGTAALAVSALMVFSGGAAATEAPNADRNRDRVADDLEARLARAPDGRRVRVIVSLRNPASRGRVEGLEDDVGDLAVSRRFSIVEAFAATATRRQVRRLAAQGEVSRVEYDAPVRALNDSAQSSFGVTKARVDQPLIEGDADGDPLAYTPGDLVAAVIDSGIDATHPDLDDGKVLAFKQFLGGFEATCDPEDQLPDYPAGDPAPYDDDGHGTHVAGTIAGDREEGDPRYAGAAPGAGLVGVKVLGSNGCGSSQDIVAGIEWVVANRGSLGIEAINLSLGVEGCSDGLDSVSRAVDGASAAGLVVAAAAGNEGPDKCTVGSPGAARSAVTVGAMADLSSSGFYMADFSSRGPTQDGRIKPDVIGPGVRVTSAAANAPSTDLYDTFSGTSMATPFVAAVALLMLDADSSLPPAEVKSTLMSTAIDWGPPGVDIDYGAGRLDAYAAIAAAAPELSAPPPAPGHRYYQGALPAGGSVQCPVTVDASSFPVAATLILPSVTTQNFEVELSGGTQSPSAQSTSFPTAEGTVFSRQARARLSAPTAGAYTLTVRSLSGAAGFFVDLSAGFSSAPPCRIASPAISGQARVGTTLQASRGSWAASRAVSYRYQWWSCSGGECRVVDGDSSYTAASSDVGRTLRVTVTATDEGGSTSATSAATAPVQAQQTAAPPPATSQPPAASSPAAAPAPAGPSRTTVGRAVANAARSAARALRRARLRRLRSRRGVAFRASLPAAGRLRVDVYARVGRRSLLVARGTRSTGRPGRPRVVIRPTRRAKRLLRRSRRLSVRVSFREGSGRLTRARRSVIVRR